MGTKLNPSPFDCYAKLEPNEPYFVIMGRDPMGHQLVTMWATGAELRLSSKVEARTIDVQDYEVETAKIAEARRISEEMATYCRKLGKLPMRWSGVAPVITRAAPKTAVTRSQVTELAMWLGAGDRGDLVLELARAAGVPE